MLRYQEMSDAPVRSKWRITFRIAIAILVVLAGVFWWRSLNSLAVIGASKPMGIISADYRPLVRIPNMKGGHYEFPPRPGPHRNWKSVPGSAGLVFTKDKGKIFSNPHWILSGKSYAVIGEANREPAHEAICPILYGKSASILELQPDAKKPETIKVRIPGNGLEPPEIHAGSVVIGDVRINFLPRPLLSPAFGIDYDIRVDGGKKGAAYFLNVSSSIDGDLSSNSALLRIEEGKPAHFRMNSWSQRTHVQGALMEVSPVSVKLKVIREGNAAAGVIHLNYPDGGELTYVKYVTTGSKVEPTEVGIEYLRGFISVEIDKYSAGMFYSPSSADADGPSRMEFSKYVMGLKDGQVIEAKGVNRISELWFSGELELPTRRTSAPLTK